MKLWIISSSLLIVIVLVLRYFLHGKLSPVLQYSLWLLVLVRLLVPVNLISTPVSIAHVLPDPKDTSYTVSTQAHEFRRDTTFYTYLIDEYEPTEIPEDHQRAKFDWNTVLTGVWITGMVGTGILLVWSNLTFYLRLQRSRKEVSLRSPLPVYEAASLPSPCLFGTFRPAIYLPEDIATRPDFTPHILAHEMAHYRHGDHIWTLLRSLALVLHWYNPLVWSAVILSRQDAELACDAAAIGHLGDNQRITYGQILLQLVTKKTAVADLLSCATTMTSGKRALTSRIRMIASKPHMTKTALCTFLLIAFIAAGCTMTGAQANTPLQLAVDANAVTIFHHNLDVIIQRGDDTVNTLLELYNSQQITETSQPMDTLHRITIHFEEKDGTWVSWNITPEGICSSSQRKGNYTWDNNAYSIIADLFWDGLYYEGVFLDSLNLSMPAAFLPEYEIEPLVQLFRGMELKPTSNEPDYLSSIRVMMEFDLAGDQPVPLFTIDKKGEVILHVSSREDAYYMCKDGEAIYTLLEELYESYPNTISQPTT